MKTYSWSSPALALVLAAGAACATDDALPADDGSESSGSPDSTSGDGLTDDGHTRATSSWLTRPGA